jgi:transglutaminase-like putative cysteine protease
MLRKAHRRRGTFLWTVILTATSGLATGAESGRAAAHDVDAAARRLAGRILGLDGTRQRLPLASDVDHARTIDPVMTEGTAIWIHEALPSPPLTVLGGRVFSYSDVTYDPLDAPVLKIRPVDDQQVIPFLLQVVITAQSHISEDAAMSVSFPAPPIFDPRLEQVEAWVGSKVTEVSIERFLEDARLDLRISLTRQDDESAHGDLEETISVIVVGELILGPYRPLSVNRFSELDGTKIDSAVGSLAALQIGRDIDTAGERDRLVSIADGLSPKSSSSYAQIVAANNWVANHLQYRESPASRSAIEALEDRSGDCDEHTTLLVALLRAMEIPARRATGLLYNFDTLATHAWVEVGLPARDAPVQWFIVDPTLAGTSPSEEKRLKFVQFVDRELFYPMRPSVGVEGFIGRQTTDLFFNWFEQPVKPITHSSQATSFVDLVTSTADRTISAGAERLAHSELLLHRESSSIVGSPYLIVDRPLEGHNTNSVQLRLENEERLVLDLAAGSGSEIDGAAIRRIRSVYGDLSHDLFVGRPAYHNLELVYLRDRHSDRLDTVSLRFGRYLVEHQLERILKKLSKAGILTEEEIAQVSAIADASGGKNLYLLQELARRVPSAESP